MKSFWLSFADDNGFLGACVVDVEAPEDPACLCEVCKSSPNAGWNLAAVRKAHQLKVNPGGDVRIMELNRDLTMTDLLPRNKLLTKDQVKALGATRVDIEDEIPGDT